MSEADPAEWAGLFDSDGAVLARLPHTRPDGGDHLIVRIPPAGTWCLVGDSPATVRWDFTGWPEAPEAGLGAGGARGAFVTLCTHVRDLELEEPSTDHTVFVHVKQAEAERAPWLAAQAGLTVIGGLEMAPY
ncbi:hypothetical protein ACIA6T_18595 [Streptomyces sp. NPDC051740]|uniref:hypothetical protein n=1 Tax=Streptomyces sp. NPDC051740 TaxID=3365673 RepID=UPI0037BC8784